MLAVLLVFANRAAAQGPPSRIRTSADPGLLQITAAVPGLPPSPVSNGLTTYDVRVNAASTKKITARLSTPMPAGVTLTVTLAAPAGATSLGSITLDTIDRDVVVNISDVNSTHAITYQLSSTAAAGVITSASRIVTFSLVNYP